MLYTICQIQPLLVLSKLGALYLWLLPSYWPFFLHWLLLHRWSLLKFSWVFLQPIWRRGSSLMGDGPRTIEIIPNYFETSAAADSPLPRSSDTSISGVDSPRTSTSGTTSHLERNSFSSKASTGGTRYLFNSYWIINQKLQAFSVNTYLLFLVYFLLTSGSFTIVHWLGTILELLHSCWGYLVWKGYAR